MVKYSFDAELDDDRLLTAEPLLEEAESFPSLEFKELDLDSVQANESLLIFLPSISQCKITKNKRIQRNK